MTLPAGPPRLRALLSAAIAAAEAGHAVALVVLSGRTGHSVVEPHGQRDALKAEVGRVFADLELAASDLRGEKGTEPA